MNFRTHNDEPIDTDQCQMQGTIQASLLQLTAAFGKPQGIGFDGDRVTTVWSLQFEDGQVATIYDWKQGAVPGPREVISWHIGGAVREIAELVHTCYRGASVALKAVA